MLEVIFYESFSLDVSCLRFGIGHKLRIAYISTEWKLERPSIIKTVMDKIT